MSSLICKNISKSFGQVRALADVTIQANGGEILALLGGNGSGKSTISKIVGGLYRKDAGQVYLDGEEMNVASPKAAKKAGIVVTSQELGLMDNFTVAENVCMSRIPTKGLWVDKKAEYEKAAEILNRIGLNGCEHKNINSLEENEKYLVEFAKAIILNPKVLILDEITSALYKKDVEILRSILMEMKEQGCIIIIITHRMNEIFDMCDRVTVLRNGEYIDTFDTENVTENELLFAMTGHDIRKASKAEGNNQENKKAETILKLENHGLGGFHSKINFELKKGEVVGVAGLQGQGQSQLVRELFAIRRPITVEYKGEKVTLKNPSDAVKRGFAFVSGNREKDGSFTNRSIAENLSVVSELVLNQKSIRKQEVYDKYKVKMGKEADAIKTLSGGNQQKVILGRWTVTEPEVLLLDDPTKGIDVNARMDVHNIIAELSERGTSVVFVSSDEGELINLARYCSNYRIIVMYNGEVKGILSGAEVTKENIYVHAIPQGGVEE